MLIVYPFLRNSSNKDFSTSVQKMEVKTEYVKKDHSEERNPPMGQLCPPRFFASYLISIVLTSVLISPVQKPLRMIVWKIKSLRQKPNYQ